MIKHRETLNKVSIAVPLRILHKSSHSAEITFSFDNFVFPRLNRPRFFFPSVLSSSSCDLLRFFLCQVILSLKKLQHESYSHFRFIFTHHHHHHRNRYHDHYRNRYHYHYYRLLPTTTALWLLNRTTCISCTPSKKNWRILSQQSITAYMPLLTATSAYRLGRRP